MGGYIKALRQLPDPRFLAAVGWAVAATLAALILLWTIVGWLLAGIAWQELWLIGPVIGWLGGFADDLGWFSFALGAGGLTWLLFPVTATAVMGLFQDQICSAVEHKHYPSAKPARAQPWHEALVQSLRFLGATVAINLLALPFYLLLLLFLGTGAFLFIGVNGYLVGREMFELAASRRLKSRNARQLRRAHRLKITLFGVVGVFLMTLPFINLIAPVITAAAAVHLYQGLKRRSEFEALEA